MEISPHLKNAHDPRMVRLVGDTQPGQAHWAGTGPEGKTCRECVHFRNDGYYSESNNFTPNRLKPGRCKKFQKMTGKRGQAFECTAWSCRFFEQNAKSPLLVRSPKGL